MNETTHVVLALFLVLSVGYTSGSVLSSSVLSSSVFQENLTQDKVAQEQVQQECDEEGAFLPDDCNVCYCLNGHLSCSNKTCFTNSGPLETDTTQQNSTIVIEDPEIQGDPDYADPDYQEDPDYKVCVEDTRWTEECNICKCTFGQILCTQNTCLRECVEGSSWVDDCNTCECYYGEPSCTDRKCLSNSATTCKEGSSWEHDCNTCFCSNGITSCSKEICPSEGDVTSTQPPETTTTCNGTFAGCSVMKGAQNNANKIKIPSELNFCRYTINGQLTYFAYIERCHKPGKLASLACAYCENEERPKYNARTCKCHKKSRFTGRK